MSYDISIRNKHSEFNDFITAQGYPEVDRKIIVHHDKPFLEFGIVNGIITFPYLRNHYTIDYMYEFLIRAALEIPGFEFEDLQSGKRFTTGTAQNITQGYIWNQGVVYAKMNQAFIRNMISLGDIKTSSAAFVPVKIDTMAILSDDTYKHAAINKEINAALDTYFPKPYVFVNQNTKGYYIDYVWEEFMNIILPSGVKISHIHYLEPSTDGKKPAITTYTYEDFISILPEPEMIELPAVLGKRLHYHNLENAKETYKDLLKSLNPLPPQKEFLLDDNFLSLYSVI